MRILVVVHRFGPEIAGGAEGAARDVARRLVERGHVVEVLTSRAVSYVDWADHFPEGTLDDDGVRVHRLSVTRTRDVAVFNGLHDRVVSGPGPLHLQEAWMQAQGPVLDGFVPWLERHAASFDVVVFFSYLYWTTWAGLPVASARTSTVLVPLAHDEPPFHLPIVRERLSMPDALAFLTPEEEALVLARVGRGRPSAVTGLGVDLPSADVSGAAAAVAAGGAVPALRRKDRSDQGRPRARLLVPGDAAERAADLATRAGR